MVVLDAKIEGVRLNLNVVSSEMAGKGYPLESYSLDKHQYHPIDFADEMSEGELTITTRVHSQRRRHGGRFVLLSRHVE